MSQKGTFCPHEYHVNFSALGAAQATNTLAHPAGLGRLSAFAALNSVEQETTMTPSVEITHFQELLCIRCTKRQRWRDSTHADRTTTKKIQGNMAYMETKCPCICIRVVNQSKGSAFSTPDKQLCLSLPFMRTFCHSTTSRHNWLPLT